jgi:hypothetical protein
VALHLHRLVGIVGSSVWREVGEVEGRDCENLVQEEREGEAVRYCDALGGDLVQQEICYRNSSGSEARRNGRTRIRTKRGLQNA